MSYICIDIYCVSMCVLCVSLVSMSVCITKYKYVLCICVH